MPRVTVNLITLIPADDLELGRKLDASSVVLVGRFRAWEPGVPVQVRRNRQNRWREHHWPRCVVQTAPISAIYSPPSEVRIHNGRWR